MAEAKATELHRATKSIDGVCLALSAVVLGGIGYAVLRVVARALVLVEWGGARQLRPHPSSVDCAAGLLLPLDVQRELSWPNWLRVVLYAVLLLYLLLGLAIVSDNLMQAVEMITSQTVLVVPSAAQGGRPRPRDTSPSPAPRARVLVWSAPVASLTLHTLGSSAPFLALMLTDLFGRDGWAGGLGRPQLGPSTILVGSALGWFGTLFLCSASLPGGERRALLMPNWFSNLGIMVFLTCGFLAAALSVFSPGVIRVWEAAVALGVYAFLVLLAGGAAREASRNGGRETAGSAAVAAAPQSNVGYARMQDEEAAAEAEAAAKRPGAPSAQSAADKAIAQKAAIKAILAKLAEPTAPASLGSRGTGVGARVGASGKWVALSEAIDVEAAEQVALVLRQLKLDPTVHSVRRLALVIGASALNAHGKSHAAHRIESVRRLSGGRRPPALTLSVDTLANRAIRTRQAPPLPVRFSAEMYAVYENERFVCVPVVRERAESGREEFVRVRSSDGSAHAGEDYQAVDEGLLFEKGETRKELRVRIMNDADPEGSEDFSLTLYRSRGAIARHGGNGTAGAPPAGGSGSGSGQGDAAAGAGGGAAAEGASRDVGDAPSASSARRVQSAALAEGGANGPVLDRQGRQMVPAARATVVITDVAGRGRFVFERQAYRVRESGCAHVNVVRIDGFLGPAAVRYRTSGGVPAVLPRQQTGVLAFDHGELLKSINIELVNTLAVRPRYASFGVQIDDVHDDVPAFLPARAPAAVAAAGPPDGARAGGRKAARERWLEECQVIVQEDPRLLALCAAVRALVPEQAAELRRLIYFGGALPPLLPHGPKQGAVRLPRRAAAGSATSANSRMPAALAQWAGQLDASVTVFGAGEDFAEGGEDIGIAAGDGAAGAPSSHDGGARHGNSGGGGGGGEHESPLLPGPSSADRLLHLLAMPVKVAAALFIPPPALLGGWAGLSVALCLTALLCVLLRDVCTIVACCTSLPLSTLGMVLVAPGITLPDLLASRASVRAGAGAGAACALLRRAWRACFAPNVRPCQRRSLGVPSPPRHPPRAPRVRAQS